MNWLTAWSRTGPALGVTGRAAALGPKKSRGPPRSMLYRPSINHKKDDFFYWACGLVGPFLSVVVYSDSEPGQSIQIHRARPRPRPTGNHSTPRRRSFPGHRRSHAGPIPTNMIDRLPSPISSPRSDREPRRSIGRHESHRRSTASAVACLLVHPRPCPRWLHPYS
jgi:hypothetical protein